MQFENAADFEILQAFIGILFDEAGAAVKDGDAETARSIHTDLMELNAELKKLVQNRKKLF